MTVKLLLVDVNAKVVAAWRDVFEDNPEVTITQGSMLDQQVDAWVTPTNHRGAMDGGLEGAIRAHLGAQLQTRVQQAIATEHPGHLPVGSATCVATGFEGPRFLISTPTFRAGGSGSEVVDVALACGAALQAVAMQNRLTPGAIQHVAMPGLGANTGRVPPEVCADLMWTAYNLLRHNDFVDFADMQRGLLGELGELGNDLSVAPSTPVAAAQPPRPPSPQAAPQRAGVLGPVVPVGPFVPRRGAVAPRAVPVVSAPRTPQPLASQPFRAPPPITRPSTLDDFDDSE